MNKSYKKAKNRSAYQVGDSMRRVPRRQSRAEQNAKNRSKKKREGSGGKVLIECSVNLASSSFAPSRPKAGAVIGKYSFKCFCGFAAKAGPLHHSSSDRCVGDSGVPQLVTNLGPLPVQRRARFTSLGHIWRHFSRITPIARVIIIISLCISLVPPECSSLLVLHPLECCR